MENEQGKGQEIYQERRQKIIEAVGMMSTLFTRGDHTTEQTPEYEAWRLRYLQAQTDAAFLQEPPGTHSHWTTG